ncbi:hypothetical protein JKF63_03688 [Porcisia hertigi]|uniref:ADP-ribosylglycohydrolase n=1 Tax=Porcisia hertigi TaxID=2761500 RepID=A0A836IR19_9TRYP|nr:hypothetical protein JKF63_03688 [Porcisia hertigi]
MVATLCHTPSPVVDNFYQNSFKQLSMVQQKQVGLLVGVSVADAAARSLNGYSKEQVKSYLDSKCEETRLTAGVTTTTERAESSLLAFARVRPLETTLYNAPKQSNEGGSGAVSLPLSSSSPSASFLVHSFTYHLYFEMLRAMSSARGEFSVNYVRERLVNAAAAPEVQQTFAAEHASLLHTLCTLLPTPAIYPYASDSALRSYLDPFTKFLTESPVPHERTAVDGDRGCEEDDLSAAEDVDAERAAVRDYTFSVLGVVLRHLQSNPDATRNAAFMAVPGTAAVFPTDTQLFVPLSSATSAKTGVEPRVTQPDLSTSPTSMSPLAVASSRWLPQRSAAVDTATVREALSIARPRVTFAQGVVQAIQLGGPTCQRAMLVGALLGAKLGVRHIPMEWLSATPDHRPVSTMALEVAQWSWNPPHH